MKKPSKHVDRLAELMHDEWRKKKIEQGWHLPEKCPDNIRGNCESCDAYTPEDCPELKKLLDKQDESIVSVLKRVKRGCDGYKHKLCPDCHPCVNTWDKLTEQEKELALQNSKIAHEYFKPYFRIVALFFVILIAGLLWQADENNRKAGQIRVLSSDTLKYAQQLDSVRNDLTILLKPTYDNVRYWAEFYGIKHVDVFLKQVRFETDLKSPVFTCNNNIVNMTLPERRQTTALGTRGWYAYYSSWIDAVKDYKLYEDAICGNKKYNDLQYINLLVKCGFAADSLYLQKLMR